MKKKLIITAALTGLIVGAVIWLAPKARAIEDYSPPVINSFSITPLEFDTSEQDQTLTLTMTITDDYAGVCISGDCGTYNSSPTQVRIEPQIGTQSRVFYDFVRTSGNDKNGTYVASLTIPSASKVGIWQVASIRVVDKLGNYNVDLCDSTKSNMSQTAGDSFTLLNTAESSSVRIEKDWTISSSTASVTFPANTIVTKQEGGSYAFYKMINQDVTIGDLTTDGLTGSPVGTLRTGIPGLNLSFSSPVTVALNVGSPYNGSTLTIKSLTEGATSWANETTCKVSSGICQFTVSHASYFSALASGKKAPGRLTLKASVKKRVKTSTARLTGKTGKYISITISVNGEVKRVLRATKKGKFSYKVPLAVGNNTISITASNGIRTKTITKTVTRR